MNTVEELLARVFATMERRAITVRCTSALAAEPPRPFGMVPLKVVSEEVVQAIAYGVIGQPPGIVARWNPLSRDASDLEPFASALDEYLTDAVASQTLPRIWLPYRASLTLIDILGHRFQNNQAATEELRRMGRQCRMLVEEAQFPGQQIVAIAGDLLTSHTVTGQSPVEDMHLRAHLAWSDPTPGLDPMAEAEDASLLPAAAMLPRDIDDRVDLLRKLGKGKGVKSTAARQEIVELLTRAAIEEWELLLRARATFLRLSLRPWPADSQLLTRSLDRIRDALLQPRNSPTRAVALARLLGEYEDAASLVSDEGISADRNLREMARRKGQVFAGRVMQVIQPNRSRRPCWLMVSTQQEVLTARTGTQLRLMDTRVQGRVDEVLGEAGDGSTTFRIEITNGVRQGALPTVGSTGDWADSVPFDGRFMRGKTYAALKSVQPQLVYGDQLAPVQPLAPAGEDLLARARRLRGGT